MTKFKCKQSGNTVSFTNADDINAMRKEQHYEEIKDAMQIKEAEAPQTPLIRVAYERPKEEIEVIEKTITLDSIKKRGRPRKV